MAQSARNRLGNKSDGSGRVFLQAAIVRIDKVRASDASVSKLEDASVWVPVPVANTTLGSRDEATVSKYILHSVRWWPCSI